MIDSRVFNNKARECSCDTQEQPDEKWRQYWSHFSIHKRSSIEMIHPSGLNYWWTVLLWRNGSPFEENSPSQARFVSIARMVPVAREHSGAFLVEFYLKNWLPWSHTHCTCRIRLFFLFLPNAENSSQKNSFWECESNSKQSDNSPSHTLENFFRAIIRIARQCIERQEMHIEN